MINHHFGNEILHKKLHTILPLTFARYMTNNHLLFVYGSLRKDFNHPAHQFISRYFNLVCSATIKGRLYDLGEYPAALPTNTEHIIKGELYEIKRPDEFCYAIAQLDDYEGIIPEEGLQALYRREIVAVSTPNGEIYAWVYWYNGSVEGQPVIECGDVLEYMKSKR
jgi:gamma-glutamylcyclotransferase (GGCT)/AIG2-like uncharacterized protein YtfP